MTQETAEWIRDNFLRGYTTKLGTAWWAGHATNTIESNLYPEGIPVADVHRRLFHWDAVEADLTANILTPDAVDSFPATPYKAVVRPDTRRVLGVHRDSYMVHQYRDVLLDRVSEILDANQGDLGISCAMLLRGGAVGVVAVEMPDSVETPEGVTFRPRLLSYSSHDGSFASAYKMTNQVVECDNTFATAIRKPGESYRVRHTRNSEFRLQKARDALGIMFAARDAFADEVAALCSRKVTHGDFDNWLDAYTPLPKDGRGRTLAETKRDKLSYMYKYDERVAPWAGTAFGVVQLANTYRQHEGIVRGAVRPERTMLAAMGRDGESQDQRALAALIG
jgi:phage/plasmid-like protein (TIGR03299 family)